MRPDQFVIEPAHPSIAGHFPGRPIVPGVVILDRTIALLERKLPGRRVVILREVKFLSPVIPGDPVTIEFVEKLPGRVTFVGSVGRRPVCRGRAELDVIV